MKRACLLGALLLALLASGFALAQTDETSNESAYFHSPAFYVPIPQGWQDQSSASVAQFQRGAAQLRTAIVAAEDPASAAAAELAELLDRPPPGPRYSGKVNLADGTWHVLVYEVDAATTASILALQRDNEAIVISFIERDPTAQLALLIIERADETAAVGAEIAGALEAVLDGADSALEDLSASETIALSSGEWSQYSGGDMQALGAVHGNDSYVALQRGAASDLPPLADLAEAWKSSIFGFFLPPPDNSAYLALGLAVAFSILGLLIFSFYWRSRGLRQDFALLQELAESAD